MFGLPILHELLKKAWLWLFPVVVAAMLVPIAPAVDTADAQTSPRMSLRQIKAKSNRKARRACYKHEQYVIPEIKTRTCERWDVEDCFYQIPYTDRGYCHANFLMEDVFDGTLIFEGYSKIEKGYVTPGLWYKMSLGPIYSPIQWGKVRWINTENLG